MLAVISNLKLLGGNTLEVVGFKVNLLRQKQEQTMMTKVKRKKKTVPLSTSQ
jgi:hypothetical protein